MTEHEHAEKLLRVRHDLLRERDRAEGLQAAADRAAFDADQTAARLADAERRLAGARARADDLERRLDVLRRSRALRLSKAIRAPASALRRLRKR